jgi:hypothetical protein
MVQQVVQLKPIVYVHLVGNKSLRTIFILQLLHSYNDFICLNLLITQMVGLGLK